ncbi:MAG TPA: Pls/PosA family non-ribosomal peptide synthetase [Pseudolabrys sp.]|nr:Pls/PosA family non-ribosomal peptide synthetase [Pseudolabrys sp.]
MPRRSSAEAIPIAAVEDRVARLRPSNDEPQLLHEFFEHQVRLRPGRAAIECAGETLSYAELDRRAGVFAAALQGHGVGPGSLVALYAEKSTRLFAAMLGVLKAGAGYVPIDPKFPVARVQGIIEDANVAAVICDFELARTLNPQSTVNVMLLEDVGEKPGEVLPLQPPTVAADDACYVIYTSGSTGRPKGVVIEHRNAVNFVRSLRTVYKLTPDDRVYQGFSIAFDASVEEIWGALSIGGTLVVPSSEVARSAHDAAEFINAKGITFFSTVPPFLSTIPGDLPTVKLLVLGGDVCPQELAHRWATHGRRMLNTYGPTEATVVATATQCAIGAPVTIGAPLPGYTVYVLNERLEQVKPGDAGELFIGGAGIARGYLNRPELTLERFIAKPPHLPGPPGERLYQTRDLVRRLPNGELQFLGRADAQIKIRGFRVELSEIEAVLMEHAGIRAAAVTMVEFGSLKELAAYVVAAGSLDRDSVGDMLRDRLPEYMVPRYLDVVDDLPQLTSGKVDKKQLPPPMTVLGRARREIAEPATSTERAIIEVWQQVFQLSPISADDDFFLDLRGHSLFAAQAVTELRQRLPNVPVSVPDLYEYRTARRLAQHLDGALQAAPMVKAVIAGAGAERKDAGRTAVRAPASRFRWACVALQAVGLLIFYAVVLAPVACAVVLILMVRDGRMAFYDATSVATIGGFLIWPTWLFLSIAVKWLVIGRYKPGFYPVWGAYYFRWWLVSRFQELSLSGIFVGTPLMNLYYRAMGAKVGRRCSIDTSLCTAFDLVSIGDDTSIGPETHLLGYRVENGWLILGKVSIGAECFVGTHCCLGLDSVMKNRSRLADMSHLADGAVIEADGGMLGSPAESANVDLGLLQDSVQPVRSGTARAFLYGLIHLMLIYAMGYILIFAVVPGVALTGYALYRYGVYWGIGAAFAAVPLSFAWYLFMVVAVKRLAIGRINPGIYRQFSKDYVRYWFLAYLLANTRYIVLPIYATLYLPPFLRMLGASIGRGVEISTVIAVMPDLLELGDGSFLADGCIVGGHRSYLGMVEVRRSKIGARSFIGNSALVPVASQIGSNALVGVMSTPPQGARKTGDGTRWLGSPSFELPNTQEVSGFSDRDTYNPGVWLVLGRLLIELIRLMLPGAIVVADLVLVCTAIVYAYYLLPLWALTPVMPAVVLMSSFLTVAAVAAFKLLLMGKFKPVVKPLWSPYVWLNDVVNAIYEAVAATAMAPLMGTPFIVPCLRMMGCKIGRRVFLETTLFSEFDLVRIGDDAALNLGSTIQTHLFEDRVMKSDYLTIGNGCSVGNMAVVLYGTEMRPGSSLDALSVLMKGEVLPAASGWTGIPTKRATVSIASLAPSSPTKSAETTEPAERSKPMAAAAPPKPLAPREQAIQSRVDRLLATTPKESAQQTGSG